MDFSTYHTELLSKLQSLGETHRINAARNDKKSQLEFLAIRVPVLRKAVRDGFSFYNLPADEILAVWNDIWFSSPSFEAMSAALIYYELQGAKIRPETWTILSTWHIRVENWAHCDSLANIYSYLLAQRKDEIYGQLQEWNMSDNQWLRRLSLISLIHYSGKKAVFMPLNEVLPLISNCIQDKRLYVQKAVGWVLRETGYVYPDEVCAYLLNHMAEMTGIAFTTSIDCFSSQERKNLAAQRKSARGAAR